MKKRYITANTCAKSIDYEIIDGKLTYCKFNGGCPGNAIGVCKLAFGKPITDVIQACEGINCGNKGTSCPDQLAKALKAELSNA